MTDEQAGVYCRTCKVVRYATIDTSPTQDGTYHGITFECGHHAELITTLVRMTRSPYVRRRHRPDLAPRKRTKLCTNHA